MLEYMRRRWHVYAAEKAQSEERRKRDEMNRHTRVMCEPQMRVIGFVVPPQPVYVLSEGHG